METEWFDYGELSEFDGLVQFFNCTLKIQIGDFKSGSKIYLIDMDFAKGEMIFYDNQDKVILVKKFGLVLKD